MQRVEILHAVDLLAAAFRRRDLPAALACFMPDDDIGYLGSEPAECADGRAAVTALLADLFARPEAYSWDIQAATIFTADGIAYLSGEAIGSVHTDDGDAQSFPYRLSGLLQHTQSGWRWRACHGCEPTTTPTGPPPPGFWVGNLDAGRDIDGLGSPGAGRWAYSRRVLVSAEQRVGAAADLPPGRMVGVGRYAVGNVGGRYFAVTRRCRHLGADLAGGHIDDGGCLVCPWHQSAYDVDSGRMVRGPQGVFAKVPGLGFGFRMLTRVLPLGRAAVVERDGDLYLRR